MPKHFPSVTAPTPHEDLETIVAVIAEVTERPPDEVRRRLRQEFERPGSSVGDDFARRGLAPYAWSEELIEFYGDTDAFLYELAIWNNNAIKITMRERTQRHLDAIVRDRGNRPARVLFIGDGLGMDCLAARKPAFDLTYFEVPGYTQRFAEALFKREGAEEIGIITDPAAIPRGEFDAVVCLDVLEHVPDPEAMVADIASYLKPDGRLIVHAPFYLIHPKFPTHLKANRRHAGSLRLYRKAGLRLARGHWSWMPIVLRHRDDSSPPHGSGTWRLYTRVGGLYFALGRWMSWPFAFMPALQARRNRWFEEGDGS